MTRSVLQVLPHPGGGGETYVDLLEPMEGFRFERVHLTERQGALELPGGIARVRRAARRVDLLHVHGDTAAILCAGLLGRRPGVITFHGLSRLRRSHGVRRRLVEAGMRRAIGFARASICVSQSELRDAGAVAGPARREKLVLINNGTPDPGPADASTRASARRELGLDDDDVAILFAGPLAEQKGVPDLILALERARAGGAPLVGLFAGAGPLRREISERGAGIGARVLGPRDGLAALLQAADAFALPSAWEGLSFSVLEAMAAGLAVVVSDNPGNRDAVGDAGLIVPYGDAQALAGALGELAADWDLRARLGEAARERALSRFGADRMIAETREVYERALKGGP